MLRDALRSIEGIDAPTFVVWRGARRCYFNGAAVKAFSGQLGESGSAFARATPFVQELVKIAERQGEARIATRVRYGDTEFVSIPLFNFDGAIEGTIVRAGRLEDIPEMYRELQADASLISQIVHLLPVLVYTVRPSGEYDFVNRSFVDYAGLALHRGIDIDSVVHPDDRANLPAPWAGGDDGRDLFTSEVALRRTDGTYRCHRVRLTAIRSKNRSLVKWIGTAVDIEDRLEAEMSLAEAHEYLDGARRRTRARARSRAGRHRDRERLRIRRGGAQSRADGDSGRTRGVRAVRSSSVPLLARGRSRTDSAGPRMAWR